MPVVNQNIIKTGALTSTATTADQSILSYTVGAGKTFQLGFLQANVKLTTFATTATDFGFLSLRQNGVKIATFMMCGPGTLSNPIVMEFDSLPFQAGDVITVVCTPGAVTSYTWEANLAGYEA